MKRGRQVASIEEAGQPPQLAASIERVRANAASPATLRGELAWLRRGFERTGHASLLLDLLLEVQASFDGLDLFAETLLVARAAGRQAEAEGILFEQTFRLRALSWPHDFLFSRYRALGVHALRRLTSFKYGIDSVPTGNRLLSLARRIGPRIMFPPALLDALFAASHCRSERPEWERRLRTAFALDHMTSELVANVRNKLPVGDVVSREGVEALRRLDDGPALLLTFHGGFLTLTKSVVLEALPQAQRLQAASARGSSEISIRSDPAAALFSALRVLQDGGQLLMAGDPNVGALKGSIEVLGSAVPIAEGAAFLAYESGCRSVWLTMRRENRLFAPFIVDAPKPQPAERFKSFKARFQAFYGTQIDRLLRGDPRNLVFRPQWDRVIASQANRG